MRIAYLECFSGISGDMFLGALVDAGVPARLLEETVAALGVGAKLEISRVVRSGISATKVDVWVDGEKDMPREEHWANQDVARALSAAKADHDHKHGHGHSHEHSHHENTEQSRAKAPAPHEHEHVHPHRGLTEIRQIISAAAISESARETAIRAFEALGAAEAKIHSVPAESIHFHEVGAADAIVDIVCAAVGIEALGVDEIVCSPLNVGGGTVKCAHGTFPVPAPATVELLKGVPDGAGSRNFPGHPNVLRLVIGEALPALAAKTKSETVSVLEANLDDLNPQVFGYVMDRLLEEGALDVFGMPVQMKKNRPGTLLTVLCKPEDAEKLAQLIFSETTTLGVRRREESRQTLARRWESVSTEWGEVRIKIASMNGTVTNYAPEYEDCRRIAAEHHVPLKTVMQEAARAYIDGSKNH